jgi:hypothetical protein
MRLFVFAELTIRVLGGSPVVTLVAAGVGTAVAAFGAIRLLRDMDSSKPLSRIERALLWYLFLGQPGERRYRTLRSPRRSLIAFGGALLVLVFFAILFLIFARVEQGA